MKISDHSTFSLPLTSSLLLALFSATLSGTLQADEVIEGGLDITALSVGTLVQNNSRGKSKGKLVYINAEVTDEQYFLDRWINGDLRYPNGTERNIGERIREDRTKQVWNLEMIADNPQDSDDINTTKVPAAGAYHFDAEALVEDEDFRIQGDATFELAEHEAGNFLAMIHDDDVHLELTENGLEMEWPDLDGAQSYHVSVRLDDPQMQTQFVTGENHYTYAEAESENIQTLIIRAFSAPPNHEYDGERTTLPIRPEAGEPIHASIFQQ